MNTKAAPDFAIRTEGLTRIYGEVEALVDLDLSVPYGSIFGYLGRNGAGKTTTIRLLTGLARPTRGKAWIGGRESSIFNSRSKTQIGYLPQEPGLYGWMKGGEFLAYTASLLSLASTDVQKQVARVLELTRLEKDARRRISGYSGGMKQRLAIAQALIGDPDILILDEPTSSLDPAGRQEVLDTLAGMRGQVTVFLSSHILGDIERVCDTIAVVHEGRLVMVSSSEELQEKYHVNKVSIVFTHPPAEAFLEELNSSHWVESINLGEKKLSILANDVPSGKAELIPLIAKHQVQIEKYEWVRPSLEEIFLEISQ
jgi:ABC-2 type transport system ATP-binding protein